jgi:hypothetical protein
MDSVIRVLIFAVVFAVVYPLVRAGIDKLFNRNGGRKA